MIVTVDTNVLVYLYDRGAEAKRTIARTILAAAPEADFVLTAQVLAEFLNVIRRKLPEAFDHARAQARRWAALVPVIPTNAEAILSAASFAQRHHLQLWDSIIWQTARAGGVRVFLTEDLQDGLELEEMRVLNPFVPDNAGMVAELFQPC